LSLASIQAGSEDGIIFKNQVGDTIGVMANADDGFGSGFAFGEGSTAQGGISFALGESCTASGARSFAGGELSTASSGSSRAIGTRAKAIHEGASVESDSQDADVASTTTDEKTFRFANGYRFLGGSATFSGAVTASNLSGTNTGDQDLSGLVAKSAYTPAHSILAQQSGTGSPTAVTLGNNTILGRMSGGGSAIAGLSPSNARTVLELGTLATVNGGTGVATALAVNVGTAGAFVVNGGTATNMTLAGTTAESPHSIGNSGTSQTLNLANGTFQSVTMTGNCTFTMPTATAGRSFTLRVNTGAGGFAGTFTGVKWTGNVAPVLTATASRLDIIAFVADGTNWYGVITQNFTP
jgi:hypothetical protein